MAESLSAASLQAYQGWAATKANGRNRQYAATMYINNATMEMVQGMREQLLGELQVPVTGHQSLPSCRKGGCCPAVRNLLWMQLWEEGDCCCVRGPHTAWDQAAAK